MLELSTKWFTNSLAKKAMITNDFIECESAKRLYIIGYGSLTSSGKNTYNVVLKDSDNKVLEEYSNLYLDAITTLILGTSPKAKANKESETNEATKETKVTNKKTNKECLYLTFEEAFKQACKMMESYKYVAKLLGKYSANDASDLALHLIKEANESEAKRIKEAKKSEELNALRLSLDIAKAQGNNMLVDAINEMIANKEKE